VLRQRFDEQEVAPPNTPSLRLSKVACGLSRLEAARLFYQICSASLPSVSCTCAVRAQQPQPSKLNFSFVLWLMNYCAD
jgi:hypothetical protein